MAHTAYLPIIADRYGAVVRQVYIVGLDLTGIEMRAQVRLGGDVPGAPEIDLRTVTNGNAEGLRLVGVTINAGLPTSHVEIVINETTMEGLPYAGELGSATELLWDWQLILSGRKQRIAKGEFVITGDGVTGADNAPAARPEAWSRRFSPSVGMATGATLTFGDETIEVTIDSAELVAVQVDRATSAQDRAETAQRKADLSAGAAQGAARYFTTRAAGEAASVADQAFATDDGAGNVIYYKRTVAGSVEIGRAVTPAALAAPDGGARVGFKADGAGAINRSVQSKGSETISVTDFGAIGDGVTDDGNAIYTALLAVQAVVNGAAVGAELIFPYRPQGYKIGRKLIAAAGVRIRVLGKGQRFLKAFDGDLWEVQNNAVIEGGDWYGGGYAGHAFIFPSGFGRQHLIGVKADTGWVDEVVYMPIDGGSQSIIDKCIFTAGPGRYAIKVADGFLNTAAPRTVTGLQTNGALGIDFGGCNDFFVSDSFVGGVRFTDNSRGVHTTGLRVANQSTVEIRGHNLVLSGGWNPIPTFMQGSDVIVWHAYCNSGRPIDQTGNGRNSINFSESPVVPVLRSDANALTLTGYRNDWGVKRSGATYTYRLDASCNLTGGTAAPGGLGNGFLYIDMPAGCFNYGAEQLVTGLYMEGTINGTGFIRPVVGLVQAIGGKDRIQLFDTNMNAITGGQAPGGVPTPGWKLTRIRGQINYSPA